MKANNLEAVILFVDFSKAFDSIHHGKIAEILQVYGIPNETITAIMMLYRNTKAMVQSPDGNTDFFNVVAGVLQGDTLAPFLFMLHAVEEAAARIGLYVNAKKTICML